MTRIAIAGGGIAGLSIAWAVKRQDPSADVVVLERAPQCGGNIRTEVDDGFVSEWGPDGFLDNAPATLALVQDVGLASRLQPSSDAARRRYIFLNGRLLEVPVSAKAFLTTELLSWRARARLLCEPFGRRPPQGDESIHDFAVRRIGKEASSILIDSMVSGIFAGDARALSLRACFPRMSELERTYGSLTRAAIATRKRRSTDDAAGAPGGRLTSFTGGMSDLIAGVTTALGSSVRTSTRVLSLRRAAPSWQIETNAGTLEADAVVLANPAAESAHVVRPFEPPLAAELERIATAPLAVVALGYDAGAIRPLNGFGFLVPRSQGVRILGALWETSIYPNRAPTGKALLRVMVGGALDRDAVTLSDATLLRVVCDGLRTTMGIAVAPEFVKIVRHRRGIAQYTSGHVERLERIAALLERWPGLHLAGNSYRGVSINSCIAEADTIARQCLESAAAARRASPTAA